MKMRVLHFLYGCANFNRRWPHWKKTPDWKVRDPDDDYAPYPVCKICGRQCTWMFGYKHKAPDMVAITAQGRNATKSETYWSLHDGWSVPSCFLHDDLGKIKSHIRGSHGNT